MSEDPTELTPYDLTAEPKAYVFLQPGWAERLEALAPRDPEYCNVCENFPCLGNHPADTIGRRRDAYTFSSVFNVVPDRPLGEWRFGPFRFAGMRETAQAELRRLAEEQDRAEWIEGVRRRLGLVAEVHRCRAWYDGDGWWRWWCLRPTCPCGGFARRGPDGFEQALAEALEHARRFVPKPPEEPPVTKLDLLAFDALADAVRAEDEAFAAALPARAAEVADRINDYLGGLLPEGMRFDWTADGE